MSFWISPSGKIILRNGKALISATSPCCCTPANPPAPTTCPCVSWPSDSSGFPCGGLLYQYALAAWAAELMYFDESTCVTMTTWFQYRIDPSSLPLNVPAFFGAGACLWQAATFDIQRRSYNFGTETWGSWANFTTSTPQILLDDPDGWGVIVAGFGAYKTTGLDPVGNYTFDSGCVPGTPNSRTIVTAEVT
jgi:hypothetical protein